jgi:SAM-dependent methyltransferase
MSALDRYWHWFLSAPFYRFTYNRIAHQVDEELLTYLGIRLQGSFVADCGCGPGIVTEKFLHSGAATVFAIDVNGAMLSQAKTRLKHAVTAKRVELVQACFHPQLFASLRSRLPHGRGFDIILFKRSLYTRREQASEILQAAGAQLAEDGVLALVHPELSLLRYAFGSGLRIETHTLYHLFNRLISRLAEKAGISSYTLYSRTDLFDLLQNATPCLRVEWVPSRQSVYNLIAARH